MQTGFQLVAPSLCTAFLLVAPAQAQQPFQTPRDVVALGGNSTGSAELYVRRIETPVLGGVQPVYGLSVSSRGEAWVGGGLAYGIELSPGGVFVRGSVMPGLHARGRGRDLGGPITFRSGLELGMPLGQGEIALGIDHRSNAGLYSENPGLNSLYLSYTFMAR
ncbi:MAG: acyloxyacyl hydrolase [Pararhodobacter sp.]